MHRAGGRVVAAVAVVAAAALGPPASAAPTPVWTPTRPVDQGYQHRVSALPGGTAWAVVDGDTALRSTDYGRTWLPVPAPPQQGIRVGGSSIDIVPVTSTTAYRAELDELWLTSDAGATWQRVAVPRTGRGRTTDLIERLDHTGGRLWLAQDPIGFVDPGVCPGPASTTALQSTSDGRRWRRSDIPFKDGGVDAVAFRNELHGIALVAEYVYSEPERQGNFCYLEGISERSGVYVTRDGGKRWQRTFECKYHCNAVAWAGPSRIVLGKSDGSVLVSADGGRSFSPTAVLAGAVRSPFDELDGLDCIGSRCFASVGGAGIFRSDDAGAEWIAEVSDKVVVGSAYGSLSMFDAERAVGFGATAVVTRESVPTPHAAGERPSVGARSRAGQVHPRPRVRHERTPLVRPVALSFGRGE